MGLLKELWIRAGVGNLRKFNLTSIDFQYGYLPGAVSKIGVSGGFELGINCNSL